MDIICSNCYNQVTQIHTACPNCAQELCFTGEKSNIIDNLNPDCLIYRYDGSDLLEPAHIIKETKANYKVATKLNEFANPLTIPKHKVFEFNFNVLSSIQGLRNERTATINRYDRLISSHWKNLKPIKPS